MVWCPTGPTSLRLKILENGKTHKQSPGGKCRARIKVGMKVGKKKGNRGIVLTDVPRSQLDLPLHSVALAPRLSYPLIVGNLLLAGDNTKNAKVQEYTKTRFPPITQQYFLPGQCVQIFCCCATFQTQCG